MMDIRIDEVESIIRDFITVHKDWWDDDESFDLSHMVVEHLVGPKLEFGENDIWDDIWDEISDVTDHLSPRSSAAKIRKVAEKAVKAFDAVIVK